MSEEVQPHSPLKAFEDIDNEVAAAKRAYPVDHFRLLVVLEKSLRMRRAALPDSHPEVMAAMRDLCLECNTAVQAWMRAPQAPIAPPDSPYRSFADVLERAEDLSEALGTLRERSLTYNTVGLYCRACGKLRTALKYFEKALALEYPDQEARTRLNLSATQSRLGKHLEAMLYASEAAIKLYETITRDLHAKQAYENKDNRVKTGARSIPSSIIELPVHGSSVAGNDDASATAEGQAEGSSTSFEDGPRASSSSDFRERVVLLCTAYQHMAVEYEYTGNASAAINCYEQGLRLIAEHLEEDSTDPHSLAAIMRKGMESVQRGLDARRTGARGSINEDDKERSLRKVYAARSSSASGYPRLLSPASHGHELQTR
ncbi:hypothetical protein FOZ60_013959 [Perkinsus olseni]|uniref:Uncharacterized protein n=1 Tax=Perkinsus olseni TaxID=32597 RepID=A0A7J6P810_PEROL|nr:hypothetical protein FOZ60_013959 [Perkinsus olseni]